MKCDFTLKHFKRMFQTALDMDYEVITCFDYFTKKYIKKVIINRFDIDFNITKAVNITKILNKLNIKGTFFLRLHSPTYNLFSFSNYEKIKHIIDAGHEIGLHHEIVDISKIWDEDKISCMVRDIDILNRIFKINIKGVSSHNDYTGYNNRKFFDKYKPTDFGLLYNAFDLSKNSFCVTDSAFTYWKVFNNSQLLDDNRCVCQHLKDNHKHIHLVLHPLSHFKKHYYEDG